MSADLKNSVNLLASTPFRERVKAAMLEKAIAVASTESVADPIKRVLRTNLALSVIADADARLDPFVRLVANDDTVSGAIDQTTVTDAQIRAIVASMWEAVGVAVPNLAR